MIIKDKFLWLVVAFLGIRIAKANKGPCVKRLNLFTACTVVICTLHVVLAWIALPARTRDMNDLWNSTIYSASFAIWCLFFIKRKTISSNVKRLNRFQYRYGLWQRYDDNCVKFITVSIISVQFINFFLQWNDENADFLSEVISFGHHFQDFNCRNVIAAYAFFSIALSYCVVYLLAFSATVLWYRWSEVLSAYNEHILSILHGKEYNRSIKFEDLFEIITVLEKLNKTFKNISFAIIVFTMDNLFMSVYEVLQIMKYPDEDYLFYTSTALYLVIAVCLLVSYATCCSKIPETLKDIQNSARQVTRHNWDGNFISSRELSFCTEIEKEHVLYVSACDMLYVSKSIILSAFGATLTYGFLLTDFMPPANGSDDCKCTPVTS